MGIKIIIIIIIIIIIFEASRIDKEQIM